MRVLKCVWKSTWGSFVLIAIITIAVYYNGLYQVARADQLHYLASVATKKSLWSLTIGSYALNRSTVGDRILFRPVLYLVLGLEKYCFGYNFFFWQLVSLSLHIGVVFVLYKILQREHREERIMPFLLALYFSVQYSSMEMVVWHHIVGYLLFALLMLIVLYMVQGYPTNFRRQRSFYLLGLCLFLAAFTYELGSGLALLVGFYLLSYDIILKRRSSGIEEANRVDRGGEVCSKKCLIFIFAVPVIYLLSSMLDLYSRFGNFNSCGQIISRGFGADIRSAIYAAFFWIVTSFSPWVLDMRIGERIEIDHVEKSPLALLSLLYCLPYMILACRGFTRMYLRKKLPFMLLVFALMCAYTGLIVLGRANERGLIRVLYNNSYYSYMFTLLLVIGLYSGLNLPYIWERFATKSGVFYSLVLGALYWTLVVMIALNICKVYEMNVKMREWSRPRRALVNQIVKLVKDHKDEKDFSFSVDDKCGVNEVIPWFDWHAFECEPLDPAKAGEYTFAQILFPQYYRATGGGYLVRPEK